MPMTDAERLHRRYARENGRLAVMWIGTAIFAQDPPSADYGTYKYAERFMLSTSRAAWRYALLALEAKANRQRYE